MNSPDLAQNAIQNLIQSTAIVTLDHVDLWIGKRHVLHDICFSLATASVTVLYGANGAGKSSLLKLLAGLQSREKLSGNFIIDGVSTTPKLLSRLQSMAYMPQQGGLYEELTALENLRFRAAMVGVPQARQRIDELVQQHELSSIISRTVAPLSGGWKQRLAFAVALLARPKILLLDEPTAGVDLEAKARIWQQIDTEKSQGTCILMSTHDSEEAQRADQLLSLHLGQLQAQGSPLAMQERLPLQKFVLKFTRPQILLDPRAIQLQQALTALPFVVFTSPQMKQIAILCSPHTTELLPALDACLQQYAYSANDYQLVEHPVTFNEALRSLLSVHPSKGVER